VQFKRRDFIWLQRGALEKAVKDGLAQGIVEGMAQGIEQGIARGKEEGQLEGKLEAARNMLRDGIPVEMVCKYTALNQETVERLRAEL
jgi:predicted transposase/invertase (TIGR01784 family)